MHCVRMTFTPSHLVETLVVAHAVLISIAFMPISPEPSHLVETLVVAHAVLISIAFMPISPKPFTSPNPRTALLKYSFLQ